MNEETYTAHVVRHHEQLRCLARRILGCNADADDALQDAYVAAFLDRHKYDESRASFYTWLYAIVCHRCLGELRHAKTVPAYEHSIILQPEDALIAARLRDRICREVAELPANEAQMFALHDMEGLGYARIGRMLSTPTSTVAYHVDNARKHLRKRLHMEVA